MRQTLKKRRLDAVLLAVAMIFVLLPVTALAAAATGTASGTQGYDYIQVNLSGTSQFSDAAAVQNTANWILNVTGDARAITGVTRYSETSARITLSGPIAAGHAFTLNATPVVFAAGTEPFAAPLSVTIHVPSPAEGTATAAAGTKNILVTLTNGSFTSASTVQNVGLWALGGASAAGNPIAGITYIDSTHATVTVTNNIGASDVYTITAQQPVFVNVMIAPFASPLSVTVSPPDTTPPAFAPGYPIMGSMQADGSRQVRVVIRAQEPAYYHFVLVPDGAPAPTSEQVKNGLDASGNSALNAVTSGSYKYTEIDTGTFGAAHNTDYDIYVVLRDDAGNLSAPSKVDVKTPPAANFFVGGYPKLGITQPNGSKAVQVLVNMQNTQKDAMIYYVLVGNGAGAPSIDQLVEGKDSTGAPALAAGTQTVVKGAESGFLVTGPADATAYDLYLLSGDTIYAAPYASSTEVFKLEITTPPASVGPDICTIGSTGYPTLGAALAAAPAGGTTTITLLQDITETGGISITGKNIVFALGSFDLTINTNADKALEVIDGSASYTGAGSFAVTGSGGYAIKAYSQNSPASVTVTSATATGNEGFAVHAKGEDASVIVNGHVSATHPNRGYGVYAEDDSSVTVSGNISAAMFGITARSGSTVVAGGNVSTTAPYSIAVFSYGNSTVRVHGNVSASGGDCFGAAASGGGEITIDGVLSSMQTYIILEDEIVLEVHENDAVTTKAGYRTYSNLLGGEVTTSVWVATHSEETEPYVVTNAATGVTATGAQLSGSVLYTGEGSITQRGFVYATHTGPATGHDTMIPSGSGVGSFQTPVTGLSNNTTYYVRAYAIYSGEVVYYANEISFTTSSTPSTGSPQIPGSAGKGLPTVVTERVSGVTVSGGTFSGRVVSGGGAAVTGRGFVLSTGPVPLIGTADAAKIPSGSGMGQFTSDVDHLLPDTTYYVRAYAINSQGTAYGETLRFTTGYVGDAQHNVPKTGDQNSPWPGWLMLGTAFALASLAVLKKRKAL